MSNEMICPYCKKQLLQNEHTLFYYCDCYESKYMNGHPVLWQALIQAKQDLEIARKALKEISLHYQDELDKPTAPAKWFAVATKMCDYADEALEQIEHKE